MTAGWLIDKSAFVRIGQSPDADLWVERMSRGMVRASTVTLLELGFSARSTQDWHDGMRDGLAAKLPVESLTPRMEQRALDVQGMLAGRGQHRAASIPDLLVAATAELADLVVLHMDKDFDLIAEFTGQQVEHLRT